MNALDRLVKALSLLPPRVDKRREWPFKASLDFQGIPIDIEQRKGDSREGVDKDGTPWKVTMKAHYGEVRRVRGTEGAKGMDGDRLDVYVGPDEDSPLVVVIDQRIPETGEFDEQKVMLGFRTVADALALYRSQYTKPGFLGGHKTMTIDNATLIQCRATADIFSVATIRNCTAQACSAAGASSMYAIGEPAPVLGSGLVLTGDLDLWQRDRAGREQFGERRYMAGPRHTIRVIASPGNIRRIVLGTRFRDTFENHQQRHGKATANALKAALDAEKAGWGAEAKPKAPKTPKGEGVIFARKVGDKPERIGGRPVESASAESMAKEFGLHEVDFGNWVSQEDRGHHVKWAHAALRDLEDVTGIGNGAIALPGITSRTERNPLAMAFGARGKGHAAAHYEPHARDATTKQLTPTINMTRFSGGGSLAHEWGHFMDNMLGEAHAKTPGKGDARFMSEAAGSAPDSMRAAAKAVVDAITRGPFAQHAAALGGYWSRTHELFARAFESYVEDKLTDSGRKNSYLVEGTREKYETGKMLGLSPEEVAALPGMKEAVARQRDAQAAHYNDARRDFVVDYAKREWAKTPRRKFDSVLAEVSGKAGMIYNQTPQGQATSAALNAADSAVRAIREAAGKVHAQPYPQGADRAKINAAMDGLMKAIRDGRHLEKAMRMMGLSTILESLALSRPARPS